VEVKGILVSSSRIRRLIRQGDIPEATQLLGAAPSSSERSSMALDGGAEAGVSHGEPESRRGTHPRPGIYAVWVVYEGQRFAGVANLGWNPPSRTINFPSRFIS